MFLISLLICLFFSQLPKTAKAAQTNRDTHFFRINQKIKRINIFDFFDYFDIFLSASKDWYGSTNKTKYFQIIKRINIFYLFDSFNIFLVASKDLKGNTNKNKYFQNQSNNKNNQYYFFL